MLPGWVYMDQGFLIVLGVALLVDSKSPINKVLGLVGIVSGVLGFLITAPR
jgi:hypothetical protein